MTTLIINFDDILRETLLRICSVPEHTVVLSYDADNGLLWMAVRADDDVPVTFLMRPDTFTVNTVQEIPIPMITMGLSTLYFQQMLSQVPNNHVLLCNIDPDQPNYELVFVNQQDGTQTYTLECAANADYNIFHTMAVSLLYLLYHPETTYRIFVPRHVMRNFVLHSQQIQDSIVVISWGHLVMIFCGAERVIFIQDNAVGFNGFYRRFRLSFHNDHVVDYLFDMAHWYFSYDCPIPVATFPLSNSMRIFLTVNVNSFVRPEVILSD